jgi:3-methyladenine DNA glycosylase/8-oxoguanine DNA glycosylase
MTNAEEALDAADRKLGCVIAAVIARAGRQQIAPSHVTPFEAVTRAIIYQGISGKAASAVFSRLRETVGRPLGPVKFSECPNAPCWPLVCRKEKRARS